MATTIDALVVTLGLDPKNFTDQQKKALDAFKKTGDEAKKRADAFEESARRASMLFSKARNEVVGLLGALAGAYGVKQFIGNLITGDAAVGRFARSTGMLPGEVDKFSKAVELAGGSIEEGRAALSGLNSQVQDFRAGLGGQILPIYNQMATEGGTVIDINKTVIEQMLAIARNARAIEARTPGRGGFFLRQIGFGDNVSSVLIQGDRALQGALDKAEKLGSAIKKDTDAAEKFVTQFRTLGQLITGLARPLESITSEGALEPLNAWLEKKLKFQTEFLAKPQKEQEDEMRKTFFGRTLLRLFPNPTKPEHTPPPSPDVDRETIVKGLKSRPRTTIWLGQPIDNTSSPFFRPSRISSAFNQFNSPSSATTTTTEINVNGPVNVQTQATDAAGIASDFASKLQALGKSRMDAVRANSGQE